MLVTTFLQAQNLNLDLELYLQFQNKLAEFICTTKGVYFLQITTEDNCTATRKIIIN